MRIHLIGVGGVAMGNLAAMLRQSGHTVTGSDHELYPPMSDRLREWGIEALPFDARNLDRADLIVLGNAISRGNAELEHLLANSLPCLSMPAALYEFFLKRKNVIVVAGTHGKTTTTFLIDHILATAGHAPGLFVGGVRADGHAGFRVSDSPFFVVEGDEYDSAIFDKGPKFLHYRPRYLVLTSVEFDHADIYSDLEHYKRSFRHLVRTIPGNGMIAADLSDEGVRSVLSGYSLAPVEWYCDASRAEEFRGGLERSGTPSSSIATFERNGRRVDFSFPGTVEPFALLGAHNTANALGAALVARAAGTPPRRVAEALESFPGVLRRQQIRVDLAAADGYGAVTLIEDFAHHPTAVSATIEAVREAYPGRRLHALFEPRSASSHRNVFQERYADAFDRADAVYLTDIHNPGKVAAGERLDVPALCRAIESQESGAGRKSVTYAGDPAELLGRFRAAFERSSAGDVVLAMSNGAFGGIYPELEAFLRSTGAAQ